MRIEIICKAPLLPEDYRRIGLSVLKELIRRTDDSLYRTFYEVNRYEKKPYTYSIFFKGSKEGSVYCLKGGAFRIVLATSSFLVASSVISGIPLTREVKVNLTDCGEMPVFLERFRVMKEVFSENVFIRDFVLPQVVDVKNKTFEEKFREYMENQGYTFESLRVRRKKTVYGIKDYKNKRFSCWDLVVYGLKGDLEKLYQEGIGHRKSQGFGFPMPAKPLPQNSARKLALATDT
jgi:CRISPR-associated endoribonuclease Cas6